jgi:hypothetical protein
MAGISFSHVLLTAATPAQLVGQSSKRKRLWINAQVAISIAPDSIASATRGLVSNPFGNATHYFEGVAAQRAWSGYSTTGGNVSIMEEMED